MFPPDDMINIVLQHNNQTNRPLLISSSHPLTYVQITSRWVVRSPTSRVVQKRKGFNITSPQCTFDKKNNRYFPWAELNYNDEPLVSTEYEAAAGTGVGIGARF